MSSDGGDAQSASDGIGSSDLPLLGAGEVLANPSNNHSAALARSLPFLYLSHALSAFGDRMWQFAIPILFMEIWDDSLLPAALFALVTNCATFLAMAHVGKWVDRSPRMALMRTSLLGQNAAIATSCLLLYSLVYLAKDGAEAVNADVGVAWTLEVKLCFGMIVACSAVGELMGNAGTLALERDWVVVLAAGDQPALAAMNSTMRRIDLLCKLLAPLGFGLLMQVLVLVISPSSIPLSLSHSLLATAADVQFGPEDDDVGRLRLGAAVVGGWNALSLPLELYTTSRVFRTHLALLGARRQQKPARETALEQLTSGWRLYARHRVFWASVAYGMIYMSVLDNGTLMTAYLKYAGSSVLYARLTCDVSFFY